MKHNYNLRVDPPMPSEEQIAKHKDFDAVLKRYEQVVPQLHRKPLYKNPKAFLGLTLAGVIALLVFQAVREEEKAAGKPQTNVTQEAPLPAAMRDAEANTFLRAPIASAAPAVNRIEVAAGQPASMRLADGSSIDVPKGVFETLAGEQVDGPVQVDVRVLRDPLDHVLAGVPLRAADGQVFHSRATVDVSATWQGQPLRLRPNAQVRLSLVVPEGAAASQLMRLDPTAQAWESLPGAPLQTVSQQAAATDPKRDDGFGVVEFGPDGRPVRKQAGSDKGQQQPTRFVQVATLSALGMYSLSSGAVSTSEQEMPVSLTDAQGQPLSVYALHRLDRKGESLASFYPQTARFGYTLRWNAAQDAVFFGFLSDGRVAYGQSKELNGMQPEAPWVLKTSASAIQNKSDLVQLLGI